LANSCRRGEERKRKRRKNEREKETTKQKAQKLLLSCFSVVLYDACPNYGCLIGKKRVYY
jgi:hypothetical protein